MEQEQEQEQAQEQEQEQELEQEQGEDHNLQLPHLILIYKGANKKWLEINGSLQHLSYSDLPTSIAREGATNTEMRQKVNNIFEKWTNKGFTKTFS